MTTSRSHSSVSITSTQSAHPVGAPVDVLIVGGGLSGLSLATQLARAGKRVVVLERAAALGGRARSDTLHEATLNQGAHALYLAGPAAAELRRLGIPWKGQAPPTRGSLGELEGRLEPLPLAPWALLRSALLSATGKWQVAKLLAGAKGLDRPGSLSQLAALSVDAWLERVTPEPSAKRFMQLMVRLTSYGVADGRMSADVAASQLALAARGGVAYLDGGWQTLVDGLAQAAREAGVELRCGALVRGVQRRGAMWEVACAERGAAAGASGSTTDGSDAAAPVVNLQARSLALCTGAQAAARVVGEFAPKLGRHAERVTPVRAACLDVVMEGDVSTLPWLTLALDDHTYVSRHSAAAALGPRGREVVHAIRYLAPDESPEHRVVRADLERRVTAMHPACTVLKSRFIPAHVVVSALPEAALGGLRGRPGVASDEAEGVFFAGDWVGPEGYLADACFASAALAARAITEHLGEHGGDGQVEYSARRAG